MLTNEGFVSPSTSPVDVMARFGNEVLNGKNLYVIDEIAAEDFVELDPLPGQPPGRDGLKTFLETVAFPAFPDQQWVTEEQIADDDKVVSRFTLYGTHQGTFTGISNRSADRREGGRHRPGCRRQMERQPHHDGQPRIAPAAGRTTGNANKPDRIAGTLDAGRDGFRPEDVPRSAAAGVLSSSPPVTHSVGR